MSLVAWAGRLTRRTDQHAAGGIPLRPGVRRFLRRAGDFAFVLPVLGLSLGVVVVPSILGLYRAFYDWQPGYESPFVGLDNFEELARSSVFHEILKNEAILLLVLPFWTFIPLVLALALNQGIRFAGVYRAIFFLPAVMSAAVLGILFRAVLAPEGSLNTILDRIGLDSLAKPWLDDPVLVKVAVIALIVWAGIGIGVVIFSAALSAVPPELFEAAEIDGASWWQKLRFIAMPTIKPVIQLWVFLGVVTVLLFSFGWIYVLTQGGPGFASTTLDFDIYQQAFRSGHFGLAAAEAMFLLVIVVVLALITKAIRRLAR